MEDHPEVAENNCNFLIKFDSSTTSSIPAIPQEAQDILKIGTPDLIVLD